MARIMLLDFAESHYRRLLDKKFDVELRETGWKSGRAESLVPPQDCLAVFYEANLDDSGTGFQPGQAARFEKMVAAGGTIVCFIGKCREQHLTEVIGDIPHLKLEENARPDTFYETKDSPYGLVFDQFRPFVSHAYELFATPDSLGKTIDLREWDPPAELELQVLAESSRNYPISALLRKGQGFYLLLPWFGEKNIEVAEWILPQVLPAAAAEAPAGAGVSWLDSSDYVFPGLLAVHKEMGEEKERHRQTLARLEEKAAELRSSEQDPFNRLLTAEGEELRQAVIRALKYLNWLNVVDVIDYWKRVIRVKEEDIWLLDEDEKSVEELIRDAPVTMVMVRDGKEAATDEDCLNLQRYKGRRMQEFNNTKLKAVLVGNYFVPVEAKLRGSPFSETQVSEATQDGNGLLTTYELFKAIKAEKEKRTTKEAIKEQLSSKVGLITFDY
jgi:hypothetical protein